MCIRKIYARLKVCDEADTSNLSLEARNEHQSTIQTWKEREWDDTGARGVPRSLSLHEWSNARLNFNRAVSFEFQRPNLTFSRYIRTKTVNSYSKSKRERSSVTSSDDRTRYTKIRIVRLQK